MAVNYNEKILAAQGSRSNDKSAEQKGVFIVDPNKVVNNEDNIIPRYVKQEDLVMYANLTAKLNPDNAIFEDENNVLQSVSIGQIGVNFLNPLKEATRNQDGSINFAKNKYKGEFTTQWSDFFTSNNEQGNFFDPETFGIHSIDVTHNAANVPVIKIEFIDVQGRTLLERGNDPTNPYNIFYRFPYPLFILTIKGYFGKGIQYPLTMTKTSTTFDSNSGNYIIRAEFLSRTFSIYNNFLLVYGALAPFMYENQKGTGDFLGKRLLATLYDKQNQKFKKIYGENNEEYKKREFTKAVTILDLTRYDKAFNNDVMGFNGDLTNVNENRQKVIKYYSELDDKYNETVVKKIKSWNDNLNKNKDNNFYNLNQDLINKLNTGSLVDLKEQTFNNSNEKFNPYDLIKDYRVYLKELDGNISSLPNLDIKDDQGKIVPSFDLKTQIFNNVKKELIDAGILGSNTKAYSETYNSGNLLTSLVNEQLLLFNYSTGSKDITVLNNTYFTEIYVTKLHKIISKTLNSYYEDKQNKVVDALFYDLKKTLGYVPNIENLLRVLMNNMQVFLTMLNLIGLNAKKQIEEDSERRTFQGRFGEYEIDENNPNVKKFYPFPNYFKKTLDPNNGVNEDLNVIYNKTYPGNDFEYTVNWHEVQFIEELYRAISYVNQKDAVAKNLFSEDIATILKGNNYKEKTLTNGFIRDDNPHAIISSLLIQNNLYYYNEQQTARETVYELLEKIMLFTTLGFLNYTSNNSDADVQKIIKTLTEHEFDLLKAKMSNKTPESVKVFYKNMNNLVRIENNQKYYDKYMNGLAGDYIKPVNENSLAIANKIDVVIDDIKNLISQPNYSVDTLKNKYKEVENIMSQAFDFNEYGRLYKNSPLDYVGRKDNLTKNDVYSLLFTTISKNDNFDVNDKESKDLNNISTTINGTLDPEKYTGMKKSDIVKEYTFKVNNKVQDRGAQTNALTYSLKTDDIKLKALDSTKKLKTDNYSSKLI